MNTQPSRREMQRAQVRRDASYDGVFCYGVRTTGVFCRPSCGSRRPRPENVEFFATPGAALRAGYRPCRRCRPLAANGTAPAWLSPLLALLEQQPAARLRDGDLRAMALPPARVRRYFRRHFGMTFQTYQRQRRLGAALAQVRDGADLTQAGLAAGYESLSGFRTAFERAFGRPPGRGRDADCIRVHWRPSPLGPLLLGVTGSAVCLLEFAGAPEELARQAAGLRRWFDAAVVPGRNALLDRLAVELDEYFAGRRRDFDLPLAYPGTAFQEAVWTALRRIPYGQTISYAELARRVGRPAAQRAVGLANGRNRIAIVIPCHRVVNKGGRLGGYGGGLWRKQFLLDLEAGGPAAV